MIKIQNTDFEVGSLDGPEPGLPGEAGVQGAEDMGRGGMRVFSGVYLAAGIFFGIILVKSEVISWFRIQEMFRLQSFHMYGVIGSAVITGLLSIQVIKISGIKTLEGETVLFPVKKFQWGQVYGGLLFGMGWALTGACPGPLFAQIGNGFTVVLVTLLIAIAGTWVYGYVREKLPH